MRLILTLTALVLVVACGDDDADLGEDGGLAGVGGGNGDGDGDGDGDDDEDGGDGEGDEDGGLGCSTDVDCTDGLSCTGVERCVDGSCLAGVPPRCSPDHPCVEAIGDCYCANANIDGDDYIAIACGGDDCDDSKFEIHPLATEVCLPGGDEVDEDCRPETFQNDAVNDGDGDEDGQVSISCFNIADDGQRFGGTDCRDDDPTTYEGAPDVCDYVDNDCDHDVDEDEARIRFYPDRDRDGYGDHDAEPILRCESFPPPGAVPADHPPDCDDENIDINIAETELCDGVDNDCDGLIDTADDNGQPLLKPIQFPDTVVECKAPEVGAKPRWLITDCPGERGDPDELLWCSGLVELGCTTEATSLDNCRDCNNACTFACGREDCDEVVGLSLGADHSCAITREGVVSCWGYGLGGRLGNGESSSRAVPTELLRIPQASAVSAGDDASCAVLGAAREVHCWGSNASAVLANTDIDRTFSPFPVPVTGFDSPILDGIEQVGVGAKHACGARASGEVYCWGDSENGRLGNEVFLPELWDFAVEVMREGGDPVLDADELAVGRAHSCIVTFDDGLDCWGDNSEGQLGDPSFMDAYSDFARPVPGVTSADDVAAGGAHTCALSGGDVLCWGLNDSGQLGRERGAEDNTPSLVDGLGEITAIVAGFRFTCALDGDGAVWCWGSNSRGQLGDPDIEETFVPTRIDLAEPAIALSAGEAHACAATANATLCWGDNLLGQLGVGQSSFEKVTTPEPIRPLDR